MSLPRTTAALAALLGLTAALPRSAAAQADPTPDPTPDTALCLNAERFLVAEVGMTTITEPDTLDDWRTRKTVAGCRVTAAGVTTRTFAAEARLFFERLRAVEEWTRTPDPRDAPNEASLRFRRDEVDCLFSFSSGGMIGTEAELRVDSMVVPGPGERRYNFVVFCMPAMEAAPRGWRPSSVAPASSWPR